MPTSLSSLLTVIALVVAATSAYFAWQNRAEREIQELRSDVDRNSAIIEDLQSRILPENIVDQIIKGVIPFPTGAVISFNLETCPGPDWKEFKLGYGRFVRGIDRSEDKIDPSGERTPGSLQSDEMKSHTHDTTIMIQDPDVDGVDSTATRSGDHHNQDRQTGSAGGVETRPKNVALLFCERR